MKTVATAPSRPASLQYQLQQEWRLVTLFLLLLVMLLNVYRVEIGLVRLDQTFYDFTMAAGPPQTAPEDIVIIAIDDGSIDELGYWPWRRQTHARLLEHLQGAKAIGLDMVFQEANPAYPDDDAALALAMKKVGVVALPLIYLQQNNQAATPLPILAEAAANMGYINIYPDPDGVVRKVRLRQPLANRSALLHFAPTMLWVGGEKKLVENILQENASSLRYIPFSGRPGHFPTYSYASVLQGYYPADYFKDKYVLIGAWSSGLGDSFSTPMSKAEHVTMPGVEILANILQATRLNSWIYLLPVWLTALLSCIPVFLVNLALLHQSPRLSLITLIFLLGGIFVINWLCLHLLHIWIPPTAGLLVTTLAYPFWHWRSQEAALRQVTQDLDKLQLDYPDIKSFMQVTKKTDPSKNLPQRLTTLHKSIELLRLAQTRREETLRFISHDMRAPQNSLLALSALQKQNNTALPAPQLLEKVELYANQTLELVDSFMDLARAEAMDIVLESVNLADVLADSMDHAWAAASRRQVQLDYNEVDNVWIKGNPAMLRRAFMNLIENAIKYGPDGNQVKASLHEQQGMAVLAISDQGWGIPEAHIATIFQAYHRAHTDTKNAPNGSGLGLAFVKTVVNRQGGEISLTSTLGQGSTFTLTFPTEPEPAH